MKKNWFLAIGMMAGMVSFGQGFAGKYAIESKEMVDGIEYANAIAKEITVSQTRDSIRIERITFGGEGKDVTSVETLPLNGKEVVIVTGSKRTKSSSVSIDKDGKALTIVTTYSYPEKPKEVEFKNTEVWVLDGNAITIVKTSDAAVTDDWTIKGVFRRI